MKLWKVLSIVVLVCLVLSGCGSAATPSPVVETPTQPGPEVIINLADTEVIELITETVSQQNCNGTAEVENQIEKSRAIEHILEAQGGVSVNANGQVGFMGTDFEVGATVAAQLGTSYGHVETIAKSVTVKARPGTNMQHLIRLTEVWKAGTAILKVGNQQKDIPFRFRYDFALELVSSKDAGCNSQTVTPSPTMFIVQTATATAPAAQSTTAQAPAASVDTGWQAEYFDNDNWLLPVTHTRVDADVNFDWKIGNPAPDIPVDNFSVRWTRCLDLEGRYYDFSLRADDRARVLVDDIFVMESIYNNVVYEASFAVSAGQHCITVEYQEFGRDAFIFFEFKPGDQFIAVDESIAWKAEYFDNSEFQPPVKFSRNDPLPAFDWKTGNPAPDIPVDNFSVRWTRCLDLEGRYYDFSLRADDRVRVLVDDIFVMESIYNNVVYEAPFSVSAGRHCITLEYQEFGRDAFIFFEFKPGDEFMVVDENLAWKAEYFDNSEFQPPVKFSRNDPLPGFDWKIGNPAPDIPVDNFSVRWTRCLDLEGREYTFFLRADDKARVLVDDIFVVESIYNNVLYEAPFSVAAGRHCITVEHREFNRDAFIFFEFK